MLCEGIFSLGRAVGRCMEPPQKFSGLVSRVMGLGQFWLRFRVLPRADTPYWCSIQFVSECLSSGCVIGRCVIRRSGGGETVTWTNIIEGN